MRSGHWADCTCTCSLFTTHLCCSKGDLSAHSPTPCPLHACDPVTLETPWWLVLRVWHTTDQDPCSLQLLTLVLAIAAVANG